MAVTAQQAAPQIDYFGWSFGSKLGHSVFGASQNCSFGSSVKSCSSSSSCSSVSSFGSIVTRFEGSKASFEIIALVWSEIIDLALVEITDSAGNQVAALFTNCYNIIIVASFPFIAEVKDFSVNSSFDCSGSGKSVGELIQVSN